MEGTAQIDLDNGPLRPYFHSGLYHGDESSFWLVTRHRVQERYRQGFDKDVDDLIHAFGENAGASPDQILRNEKS